MTLGGAPVYAELLQRMRSGLPSIQPRIATGYGLSENCGQATELAPQHLQEQLRTRVASFAVPSRWRLQTKPLPVNQTGKVDKAALVAQARADLVDKGAKAATYGR
jgi:acyl-CoA synthetase (AMP-forming)/AMP-acid ligase II